MRFLCHDSLVYIHINNGTSLPKLQYREQVIDSLQLQITCCTHFVTCLLPYPSIHAHSIVCMSMPGFPRSIITTILPCRKQCMLLRFSFITMQVINMFSREYMHRGTQSFTRTGSLPIIHTPLYKRANVFAYHCSKTECGCCKNVYCVTVCVYGYVLSGVMSKLSMFAWV